MRACARVSARSWFDCWLGPAARQRHRCGFAYRRASAWALRSDAKADSRRFRVVARVVVRARCGPFLFGAADASSPHLRVTLLSSVLGACRSGVLRGVNAHREPTKSVARVEDLPRAVILFSSYEFFVSACFLQFSVFSIGGLSIHSNFSTSAAICALGERGVNRNRVTG